MLKVNRRNKIPRDVMQTSLVHLMRASASLLPALGPEGAVYELRVRGAARRPRSHGTQFLSGPFRPEVAAEHYPFLAEDIRRNATEGRVCVVLALELDGQNHCSLVGCPAEPPVIGGVPGAISAALIDAA